MAKIGSPSYYVRWVFTEDFPDEEFPLVFLHDGQLSYSLTLYMKCTFGRGLGKQTSSLNDLFQVVGEMKLFFDCQSDKHEYWNKEPRRLVVDYFDKKLHGTVRDNRCELGLYWVPSKISRVRSLLNRFNEYQEFCSMEFNSEDMLVSDVIASFAIHYGNFCRQTKFSLLAHLTSNYQEKIGKVKLGSGMRLSHQHEYTEPEFKKKYFPKEYLAEFVDFATDINQQAMYLLCAFCGLRASEALQIMVNDIVTLKGELLQSVILSHPNQGHTFDPLKKKMVERKNVLNSYGEETFNVESEYVQLNQTDVEYCKRPRPRTQLPIKNPFHCGWKGVRCEPKDDRYGYVLKWTNENARLKFCQILSPLLRQERVNHPYLICGPNGAPLRKVTFETRFVRQAKKLTGEIYRPHSLRHFTGYYCANCLDLTIDQTQVMLRHKSIASTQVYYHLDSDKVRSSIAGNQEKDEWKKYKFNKWSPEKA